MSVLEAAVMLPERRDTGLWRSSLGALPAHRPVTMHIPFGHGRLRESAFNIDADSRMQSVRAISNIAQTAHIQSNKRKWRIIVQLARL